MRTHCVPASFWLLVDKMGEWASDEDFRALLALPLGSEEVVDLAWVLESFEVERRVRLGEELGRHPGADTHALMMLGRVPGMEAWMTTQPLRVQVGASLGGQHGLESSTRRWLAEALDKMPDEVLESFKVLASELEMRPRYARDAAEEQGLLQECIALCEKL